MARWFKIMEMDLKSLGAENTADSSDTEYKILGWIQTNTQFFCFTFIRNIKNNICFSIYLD